MQMSAYIPSSAVCFVFLHGFTAIFPSPNMALYHRIISIQHRFTNMAHLQHASSGPESPESAFCISNYDLDISCLRLKFYHPKIGSVLRFNNEMIQPIK